MAQEWTPDTDWIQGMYAAARLDRYTSGPVPDPDAEFERWITAHDQEVRRQARLELLDELDDVRDEQLE